MARVVRDFGVTSILIVLPSGPTVTSLSGVYNIRSLNERLWNALVEIGGRDAHDRGARSCDGVRGDELVRWRDIRQSREWSLSKMPTVQCYDSPDGFMRSRGAFACLAFSVITDLGSH
jgi:hypothetical protein